MKRSPLAILFVTIFIDLLGFGLILPNIPIYIQHYGGAPWIGGMLLAAYSVTQFLFAPIWGSLSDRVGRRPLILLSLIGSAISFFFFGWAPSLAVLFIARVAAGILSSASLPTAQAYVADVTPPERRAGGMAVIGAAFGLGFVLGPVFGGLLAQHPIAHIAPLAMPAYAAALLALLNFAVAIFLLPETHHDRTQSSVGARGVIDVFPAIVRSLTSPSIGPPMTVFAFATFAFTAVESSFSWLVVLRFSKLIHSAAESAWNRVHPQQLFSSLPIHSHAGIVTQQDLVEKAAAGATTSMFIVVGITTLVVQLAVMRGLARRVGEHRLVMFGSLLLAVTLVAVAFVGDINALRVLAGLIAVGNGVLNPSLNSLITQFAGPGSRGAVSGTQQGIGSLARIIAPPINNGLVGIWAGIPFLGSAVMMGAAFILSLSVRPLTGIEAANLAEIPPSSAEPDSAAATSQTAEQPSETANSAPQTTP